MSSGLLPLGRASCGAVAVTPCQLANGLTSVEQLNVSPTSSVSTQTPAAASAALCSANSSSPLSGGPHAATHAVETIAEESSQSFKPHCGDPSRRS